MGGGAGTLQPKALFQSGNTESEESEGSEEEEEGELFGGKKSGHDCVCVFRLSFDLLLMDITLSQKRVMIFPLNSFSFDADFEAQSQALAEKEKRLLEVDPSLSFSSSLSYFV